MRCVCCNRMLTRSTGYRLLPDGTKVEETFCNVCRNEVNKAVHEAEDYDTKEYKFEGIIQQQILYGSVTPPKTPSY